MSQIVTLKCRGLYTFPNNLAQAPEGSLSEAFDIVIDRNDVAGPRRGFAIYGSTMSSTNRAKQVLAYKNRAIRHYLSKLQYDSDGAGTFVDFLDALAASVVVDPASSTLRIKGIESNGNFYFTSSSGIRKISAVTAADFPTAPVTPAGGIKALDIELDLNAEVGFFTAANSVAYRAVWGIKDANGNEILGAPSALTLITNSTATARTVNVYVNIPPAVTTAHFVQIYRTPLAPASSDPGDDENLVYEANPTAAEITAKQMAIHDVFPDDFREGSALLYTNKNSGDGILQANDVPPLANDITFFRNTTFYANTKTFERLSMSLLGVVDLVSGTSKLSITDGTQTDTYTFTAPVEQVTSVTTLAAAGLAGTYFLINSARNKLSYYVWFKVDGTGADPALSGKTGIEVDLVGTDTAAQVATKLATALDKSTATFTLDFTATAAASVVTVTNVESGVTTAASAGTSGFTVSTTTAGDGEDAANKKVLLQNSLSLTPSQQIDDTARSIVRVINKQSSGLVNAFYLSTGPDDLAGKFLLEARSLGQSKFYAKADSTVTGDEFNPSLPTTNTLGSDSETSPNRIYYSKVQQPEAVPILNFTEVGAKDQAILRILALRGSLFIFKEDGIYRLTGDTAANFQVTLFDSSAILIAPDTAVVLNNQIYGVTTQGATVVSDTGVSVISRPIEDKILPLTAFTNFPTASFAVAYESDRAYLLWTVTQSTDGVATQCLRYNTFTQTWTIWTVPATCGLVINDKIHLGAGDVAFIKQERKSFTRLDYADTETAITIPATTMSGSVLSLGGIFGIKAGDAIVQTQYLTMAQFNRLLKQLDTDSGLTAHDYFFTLQAMPGDDLSAKLSALVTKLNAIGSGTSGGYTSSGSSTPAVMQTDFNGIVTQLIADPNIRIRTYKQSTGTDTVEAGVLSVDTKAITITLAFAAPLIAGAASSFAHIESSIEWSPHAAGDPSVLKHFSVATILFETDDFTTAIASYASDLSPGFTEIVFSGEGTGTWGGFSFGQSTWGGEGTTKPFRTYVPREKQRCRFIIPRFEHGASFERYEIFGLSLTVELSSTRGYK